MFFLQERLFWNMLIPLFLKSHGAQSQNILAKLKMFFGESHV